MNSATVVVLYLTGVCIGSFLTVSALCVGSWVVKRLRRHRARHVIDHH